MNEEIAMRTLAYLITHYKEHDETIINLEEIQAVEYLQQENQQLKDNWNKLKKYAEENLYFYSGYQGEDLEEDSSIKDILDKMKELEGELE